MNYLQIAEIIFKKMAVMPEEVELSENTDTKGVLITVKLTEGDYWEQIRGHGYKIKIIAKLLRIVGKKDGALVSLRLVMK